MSDQIKRVTTKSPLLGASYKGNSPQPERNTVSTLEKTKTDVKKRSIFLKSGNTFTVTSDSAMDMHETLPVGNYVVRFHPERGFWLEESDEFTLPSLMYGPVEGDARRILNTHSERKNSTGVLLVGEQGSGKTLLSKAISVYAAEKGIPTIIVNAAYCGDGFNTFLNSIDQPIVVLFDEFEKVYDKDHQPLLLTLFDGVIGGKKIYVLTANDKWNVNNHMRNRPGRFFYMIEFKGLEEGFIRDYCIKNIHDQRYIDQIMQSIRMFECINFDMLQALVEELNRYGGTIIQAFRYLNVKPNLTADKSYSCILTKNGEVLHDEDMGGTLEFDGNPFAKRFRINYFGKTENQWKQQLFFAGEMLMFDAKSGTIKFRNVLGMELTLVEERGDGASEYEKFLAF